MCLNRTPCNSNKLPELFGELSEVLLTGAVLWEPTPVPGTVCSECFAHVVLFKPVTTL